MLSLGPENVLSYLQDQGICDPSGPTAVEALPGGVSNTVLAVRCGEREYVLKQALARLQVEDEWLSDVERIEREAECQKFLLGLLDETTIPPVVMQDRENHAYVMQRVPRDRQNWKELLLAGHSDPRPAQRAGEILGIVHNRTAGDPDCVQLFAGKRYFVQLRLDPYYGKVAQVYPRLQESLQRLSKELLERDLCFVHGDYSPKNMLVKNGDMTLLDFEVGHYGNPVFDLGFFLTHLFLKTLKHRRRFGDYQELIRVFWRSYVAQLGRLDPEKMEVSFLPHLGVIMLARIDGKSKVNYLTTDEQDWVRNFAPALIGREFDQLGQVLDYFETEVKRLRPE